MSLPGLVAQPLAKMVGATVAVTGPIDAILGSFNGNLYFIGIMMLILNLGGRFIAMEITKEQEGFFQHPWVRRFLIFVVLFVATRNLMISFWLTIIVVLTLGYLFNENSALCIIGKGGVPGATCTKGTGTDGKATAADAAKPGMTPEEMEIFRRLNEKKLRYDQAAEQTKKDAEKKNKFADPSLVYLANMNLLNQE
jgi:hypothetical protein